MERPSRTGLGREFASCMKAKLACTRQGTRGAGSGPRLGVVIAKVLWELLCVSTKPEQNLQGGKA